MMTKKIMKKNHSKMNLIYFDIIIDVLDDFKV